MSCNTITYYDTLFNETRTAEYSMCKCSVIHCKPNCISCIFSAFCNNNIIATKALFVTIYNSWNISTQRIQKYNLPVLKTNRSSNHPKCAAFCWARTAATSSSDSSSSSSSSSSFYTKVPDNWNIINLSHKYNKIIPPKWYNLVLSVAVNF